MSPEFHAPSLPKAPTADELAALRAVRKNARDQALIELMASCGLRVSEACGLTLRHLHLDRAIRLHAQGGVSTQEPETLRYEAEVAQRRWEEADLHLSRTVLRAAITGCVAECTAQVGQLPTVGHLLVVLVDPTDLKADLYLPAAQLARIGPRQSVQAVPVRGTVLDISGGGLRLRVDHTIPPGSRHQIDPEHTGPFPLAGPQADQRSARRPRTHAPAGAAGRPVRPPVQDRLHPGPVPGPAGILNRLPEGGNHMAYAIPKTDCEPHPAGRHLDRITQHEDKGLQDTPWGQKHKVAIYVESETAFMEDGAPFLLVQWFTLSSNERAALRKFREAVLDRPLNDEEIACFDADAELLWKRIRFRVDHVTNEAGKVRAVIREGSVEPVDDHDDGGGLADEIATEPSSQRWIRVRRRLVEYWVATISLAERS